MPVFLQLFHIYDIFQIMKSNESGVSIVITNFGRFRELSQSKSQEILRIDLIKGIESMNLLTEHYGFADLFRVGTNKSVSDIFFKVFDFSDTNFCFKTSQFSTNLGAESTEDLLKLVFKKIQGFKCPVAVTSIIIYFTLKCDGSY